MSKNKTNLNTFRCISENEEEWLSIFDDRGIRDGIMICTEDLTGKFRIGDDVQWDEEGRMQCSFQEKSGTVIPLWLWVTLPGKGKEYVWYSRTANARDAHVWDP